MRRMSLVLYKLTTLNVSPPLLPVASHGLEPVPCAVYVDILPVDSTLETVVHLNEIRNHSICQHRIRVSMTVRQPN